MNVTPSAGERPEVSARSPSGLREHALRATLIGELHARPFEPISVPRQFCQFAFLSDDATRAADVAALHNVVKSAGGAPPAVYDSYLRADFGSWDLRWEQHTEFTTCRWGTTRQSDALFSSPPDFAFKPSGELLVAVLLSIVSDDVSDEQIDRLFDPSSLCLIEAEGGEARIATDFQADPAGFTRILIIDKGMNDVRAGALVQRVLEIETYRTLALLGLPPARQAAPIVRRIEEELADLTNQISQPSTIDENHRLLQRLTKLAAELEAQAAQTGFRFGASRAYHEIVQSRLNVIRESAVPGHSTISGFFARRLSPAISTCNAVEKRQDDLSRKLTRAAELLRTQIQFELEQQNRDLLKSMDRRAHQQLRLQQTVEGLSVAAVSYYAVGLINYLLKGLKGAFAPGLGVSTDTLTALSVPFVVFAVWWIVRSIRKKFHGERQANPAIEK